RLFIASWICSSTTCVSIFCLRDLRNNTVQYIYSYVVPFFGFVVFPVLPSVIFFCVKHFFSILASFLSIE
ncbi:unnamed protein product, partial [Tenebrio molitor]